ncbi:MAG: Sec translocon accessory complex subunit YajC [Candidatus Westeberhardia cardiocondylae]|nr:Sec translocon accessory complex subunit YajC [Candidatus Westeberhardia cardiocondylae]
MHIFSNTLSNTNNSTYQDSPLSFIIILLFFSIIFYFVIFRPQQNRAKAHKKLINSISKGDEILTTGGLIGRVIKITKNDYVFISLNTKHHIIIKKEFIASILPKGTIKTIYK